MRTSAWWCLLFLCLCACDQEEVNPSDLESGLVAYYPFNASTHDESGNNYHLTAHNTTFTQDYSLKENKAISLNGQTAGLDVPGLVKASKLTHFTISLWAKPTLVLNKTFCLLSLFGQGGINMDVNATEAGMLSANRLYVPMSEGFGIKPLSQLISAPAPGTWVHLVMGQSDEETFLYANGVKIKSIASTQVPLSLETGGTIGYRIINAGNPELERQEDFFNGVLDNLRIYNRSLSSKEIDYLFSRKD
ncbi:LamG domain-containing protein [Rufibacter immobilis]|uniref:LamG domain-containing protein n=1 Tax=Rufibacter immobilis TaxID=1348778 RepID=A0A3M9MXE5_9BACT|nr:LamG domain-containing protein [Rufibacter immobilis]RNI29825.1 LamG domain-containing protein [Rufibacter immobilis]